MPYVSIQIAIDRLLLDPLNPRTGETDSQQDAILAIIADQGNKIFRLAEDIVENGLSPAMRFLVIKQNNSSKSYIALDGNRRLAALKLLRSPELATETSLHKKFLKLHRTALDRVPAVTDCVSFPSREEANIWIQRLHDRGLEGMGSEGWTSEAKSRFQAAMFGKLTLEQQIVDSVRKLAWLPEEDRKAAMGKVATTTIRRIIDDVDVRKSLGFSIENDRIIGHGQKKQVAGALIRIVLDVAHKRIKVGKVYDKDGRREYLSQFDAGLKIQKNDTGKKLNWDALEFLRGPETKTVVTPGKEVSKKALFKLKGRKKIIPYGFSISVTTPKAQYLFGELRKPDVEDQPLLLALGLRTFLEISCYEFQKRNKLEPVTGNVELHKRIELCADHLQTSGAATQNELKGARVVAKSHKDYIYSTNTLNSYVHNTHFVPNANDLLGHWDHMQPFLVKLWE